MRRICAGVNVGNICSNRELFSGSPLGVSPIEVICSALLLTASFLRTLIGTQTASNELRSWVQMLPRPIFINLGNYVVKLILFLVILGQTSSNNTTATIVTMNSKCFNKHHSYH